MIIVPEKEIAGLLGRAEAFDAVEAVFAAMSRGDAYNFPVIREAIGHADALYGFKSGFDRAGLSLGLKSGGYWPGNEAKGLTNHQSTVFLFDADTGQAKAVVGGNLLTALRTAAASSVSIKHLARADAKVLGMIGAGHQSAFQMRAAVEQRNFEKVIGWNLHPEMLSRLAETATELDLPFEAVDLNRLGAEADVIISITSSFDAILMDAQVTPGTHIACMGTDTKGKQEVEAALVARATVFTDEIAQAVTIGECQHAVSAGTKSEGDIVEIGAVINGTHPGRSSQDEVTLFDGTGVGLQDLAVASKVVDLAVEKGVATVVDF
ncbi:iminosuccinate reductase BhcD [Pseudohalocynthiibacter aestuariivivens]|jgi:ornithine cyclodeaminase/alanine dehydrogenase-like protein (mu-crystallin family)|uniref:Iminosuccinate reductase BhcD n=1 Tax=Pseudohalocynthiibacter aestuariivivens TaxID=1591409 RepID=A0ABV5JBD7_9RHOB|nr:MULTISPECIES: iminosuccinate reductase BhcD [Pseudohalocynthiibacter]MBS9715668.1 ornithine cyclodeaminase family protein [Pseudohalocynthiibacter aestuariivivens]MCK0101281.1 ornithine cyclodeaminase family protein [Pseudohalocynthiibacter sp. F2068]